VSEIKVTDRRMFTPDGRLREEYERELAEASSAAEAEPAEAPAIAAPVPEPVEAPPETAGAPSLAAGAPAVAWPEAPPAGLLELVDFLAQLSLVCLGEAPMPDGRLARDLDAARFYIDLIGAFHERWGKRLGPQESRFLESYLDQLRLRYVARRG
jgi:hypothetical protein